MQWKQLMSKTIESAAPATTKKNANPVTTASTIEVLQHKLEEQDRLLREHAARHTDLTEKLASLRHVREENELLLTQISTLNEEHERYFTHLREAESARPALAEPALETREVPAPAARAVAPEPLYAEPENVTEPASCDFFYQIDLPGIEVGGRGWDLRESTDSFLGRFDFSGKRVLDVRPANGFLSFEIEKRGGSVVSADVASSDHVEIVPYGLPGFDVAQARLRAERQYRRLRNAYWLSHRLLGSKVQVHYGNLLDLTPELGKFDVAVLGLVLGRLRDPFRALQAAALATQDWLIITQPALRNDRPFQSFLPSPSHDPHSLNAYGAWWNFTDGCMRTMVEVLGFTIENEFRASHRCLMRKPANQVECLTIVARNRMSPTR